VITAVDTNVLLDVFSDNAEFGRRSANALKRCITEGSLLACDIVWAETAAWFPDAKAAEDALSILRVGYSPLTATTALQAGRAWQAYRQAGGTRERVIADFLIGTHATAQAHRLLTRDRGFYRSYFAALPIIDPGNKPARPPDPRAADSREDGADTEGESTETGDSD
jgi:predicted nucleic acid-binding protein